MHSINKTAQAGPGRAGRHPGARILAALAVVASLPLFVALTFAAPNALQPVPSDVFDVRANQDTTNDQHEPSIAVDPTNPNNVIIAAKDWRTGPKQVWYYRSTDGGHSWSDGHVNLMPSELPNQSDPVVSFASDGTAYLTMIGYNAGDFSVGGMYIARSHDAGATWEGIAQVSQNREGIFNDKEWTAVDRSANPSTKGNIYVTWTLFTTVSPQKEIASIVVSRSTDGGKTFSTPKPISPPQQEDVQGSYPVVGKDGQLYVLYYEGLPGETDPDRNEGGQAGGQSAGRFNIAPDSVQGQTPASGGRGLYMVASTDGGATFKAPAQVAEVVTPPSPLPGVSFRVFVLPVLAVDPNSNALYAIWNDYRSANSDVLFARSSDGGATWSQPARLNDDPTSATNQQYFPTLSVGKDGTVHAMWLDTRDDASRRLYRPYYARSTDGGRTFSKNIPLSATQSNPNIGFEGVLIGDYVSLDTSLDGSRVYAAWVDTREGTQDIYYTSVALTTPLTDLPISASPQPVPIVGNGISATPSPQPLSGFNDNAFEQVWDRADIPVLRGQVSRPWVWGPTSFAASFEAYQQGQNGRHEVLYFDKARMENNNPRLDPNNPGYVTNGLLVVELISGRIQTGDNAFDPPLPPSTAPVAGDSDSPDALTYASLAPIASLNNDNRASDRTGQGVSAVLDRNGQTSDDPTLSSLVNIAVYEPTLGHNIPDVFWNFMNSSGPVYNNKNGTLNTDKILDWPSALGYPITEPYWTHVKIGGVPKTVLVQAFQRRVLTYTADNPPGWQVEMGNVGRHYFDWRYGR